MSIKFAEDLEKEERRTNLDASELRKRGEHSACI
jgi:hypothetical protein